ncbi:prepilin-type N-terminal cleavage/methylation domain-containing protein [Candidatus Gracilibacteria bacterium]|nr:prepilin-type N-terminal cleavage/methylation domain-containing protein [Candidatus Gracilibacteria bacterium]
MKSTNKKGFTLVELIIVITILAILATIAFLSFQGYSAEARDSGKMSELSETVKSIAIKEARDNTFTLDKIGSGTEVDPKIFSGTLDKSYLGLNSKNDYAVASWSGVYAIAAKMEKYDDTTAGVLNFNSNNYFVTGNGFLTGTSIQIASGTTVPLADFFGTTNLPTK